MIDDGGLLDKSAMRQYKLAFVIERYFEFGGLQRNMRRLAVACAKEGHAVTIFTGRWNGPPEPRVNVEIVDFKAWSNHQTIKKMDHFVRELRHKNEFDCITGFNRIGGLDVYYGGDVCLRSKLQRQNQMWRQFLSRYRTYLKMEETVFGPASDSDIMLISENEAEKFRSIYKTASDRIHLLPPGIDRDRLMTNVLTGERRKIFRAELGVGEDELLILTVGSSFHTKGIDRAIDAIASLADGLKKRCRYVVVGLGKEKKFRTIAQKVGLGDRVVFTGGRGDIANFYHAGDVLLHPARTENTGNTLLEAMVTGLTVIATENCGYAHYIRQANAGAVCPEPFDKAQLNQVLNDILTDDRRRQKCGKNGSEYCQNADIYSRIEKGVEVIVNRAKKNGTADNAN
ncbi:MAG: glycosyltransferase family 1 protein [Planctomycetota bacterium]|nr:MAG: glycosyltransferase family 1 protein [Planctomycetota bacterium]